MDTEREGDSFLPDYRSDGNLSCSESLPTLLRTAAEEDLGNVQALTQQVWGRV